jgi:hypothetical protein
MHRYGLKHTVRGFITILGSQGGMTVESTKAKTASDVLHSELNQSRPVCELQAARQNDPLGRLCRCVQAAFSDKTLREYFSVAADPSPTVLLPATIPGGAQRAGAPS